MHDNGSSITYVTPSSEFKVGDSSSLDAKYKDKQLSYVSETPLIVEVDKTTGKQYEDPDTQYFYFRSLIDVCKLGISVVKTRNGNINIRDGNVGKHNRNKYELTMSEKLEIETKDMDEFYLHHDLDDVIKYSPNIYRPIGSERKKK